MRAAGRWAISAKRPREAYQFSRADQDAYAIETLTRARKAIEEGAFAAEIAPVVIAGKTGTRSSTRTRTRSRSRRRRSRRSSRLFGPTARSRRRVPPPMPMERRRSS